MGEEPGGGRSRAARAVLVLSVLVFTLLSPRPSRAAESPDLPRGEISSGLTCSANPTQSYDLYLPTQYDPSRAWPILYVLDARGRARVGADLFRAGAEKLGFVVASSANSASDEKEDPNTRALGAMWEDTHQRLRLDDSRVYLAGLSGTARAALDVATSAQGKIRGVVAAAAGFPSGRPPTRDIRFLIFATVGEEDFNYYEVTDLGGKLQALDLSYRIEVFPGSHGWMPEEVAAWALEWLRLQEMRGNEETRDEKWIDALWGERLKAGRALEEREDPMGAVAEYRADARDFQGLRDVSEAESRARALSESKAYRNQSGERDGWRRRVEGSLSAAWVTLGNAAASTAGAGAGEKAARDLGLSAWKRRADGGKGEERLAARRFLSSLLVQVGYYLPEQALDGGDSRRAATYLSVATSIRAGDTDLWLRRARAELQSGDRSGAIRSLRQWADLHPEDRKIVEEDPAFAPLKDEADFRKILDSVKPAPKKSSSP
jgi:predicted esterase